MATNTISGLFEGVFPYDSTVDVTVPTYTVEGNYNGGTKPFTGSTVGGVQSLYEGYIYYTSFFKFTTANFVGVSKYLKIDFDVSHTYGNSINLRYALCVSDSNYDNYCNTFGDVYDENQISTGLFTVLPKELGITASVVRSITIPTQMLRGNTTYYVMLWADGERDDVRADFGLANYHAYQIGYDEGGIIYIDNGTEFEAHQCYIDNGTNWDTYIPYVDNGTSWDICT